MANEKPGKGRSKSEHLNQQALLLIEEEFNDDGKATSTQTECEEEKWKEGEKGKENIPPTSSHFVVKPNPEAQMTPQFGKPIIIQKSDAVRVGERTIIFLASKRWGPYPASPCLILRKCYIKNGRDMSYDFDIAMGDVAQLISAIEVVVEEGKK